MNRLIALLLVLALLVSGYAVAEATEAGGLRHDVLVLFTSDVHCGVDQNFGYAGLQAVKDAAVAAGDHVLLVDDGDSIQGEPIGILTGGEAIIELMNTIGYDVAIPGNHEFDYGMERFMELVDMAEFPYISCNFHKDGALVLEPYVIREFDGVKIAFVGVTTPKTLTSTSSFNFQDGHGNFIYDFSQGSDGSALYATVQQAVDAARAEGADYVFAMAHLGNGASARPYTYADVLSHTTGIDAMLDGHSHDADKVVMKNADGKVVIRQACGTKLEGIGWLRISAADGSVDTGLYSWNNDVPAPELLDIWNEMRAKVDIASVVTDDYTSNVIGVANVDLMIDDPVAVDAGGRPVRIVRRAETNLGDLCADAFRDRTGADVGLANGGSIRKAIPKGDITMSNIMGTYPFGNKIFVIEATGRQILDTLEYASNDVPNENGPFLQVSGMTYEIHTYIESSATRDDNGMYTGITGEYRVKNVRVNGEPLDPDKTYRVAAQSYIVLEHGGGMTAFDGAKLISESKEPDYELVADYIANTLGGVVGEGYENPYGSGRIIAVEEPAEATGQATEEESAKKTSFFDNPEINALIDANYEQICQQGWAELRIPQSLHGITEDMLSPNALDVAHRLLDAGFEARIIGGAMRDIVMGTKTMDFDIVTNATIDQQLELMDDMTFHTVQTGQTFGYVHYPDEFIDLAQCLNIPAAYYGMDGVPDFDPEQLYSDSFVFDSFERDLPINAIYYDVATGDLVDYHGGLRDIREGIIRSIGDPEVQFAFNPPSMIRALRFKSRYGYDFSERVEEVMREKGVELLLLNTPATIRYQLVRFWPSGYARACYETLSDYGLIDALYPPLAGMDASDYLATAAEWMDEWHGAGNLQSDDFAMAAFLWPAVAGAEDVEVRAAEVFAQENQVCEIDEALAAHYTAMYALQADLEKGGACEDTEALMAESAFEDAYELLLIRARTENGLEEAAVYWTAARQAD